MANLYSMKIKEQTRKELAKTQAVLPEYGKATLTWFEFDFRRVLKDQTQDCS